MTTLCQVSEDEFLDLSKAWDINNAVASGEGLSGIDDTGSEDGKKLQLNQTKNSEYINKYVAEKIAFLQKFSSIPNHIIEQYTANIQ